MRRGALLSLWLFGCASPGGGASGDAPGSVHAPAVSATAQPSQASAAATSEAPPPPPPPVDPNLIRAAAPKGCEAGQVSFALAPLRPEPQIPLRAFVMHAAQAAALDGVVAVDPSGNAANLAAEPRPGPPRATYVEVERPAEGNYRLLAHRAGKVVGCHEVAVKPVRSASSSGPQGIAWPVTRAWDAAMEDLYSAWIEKLFDSKVEESFSFTSLDEITRDPKRNFLHDYLDIGEDAPPPKGLRLDPDCADLPYFLRAYFAFKLGLPFGYSACSRGGGGRAPTCGDRASNLDPLDEPVQNRVRRFETFLRADVKNVVHSGTGRTRADDSKTDYYPVRLSSETIRPGTVFADPYGHLLVVARRIPQTQDRAGALFAVDGQPDGTVAKKRFWQGNFLFSQEDPAMGSPGFKRFRPVVVRGSGVGALSNDAITRSPHYGDFSTEQTEVDTPGFYDKMDEVLSPEPLDPERALLEAVVALEEQVKSRVVSVDNGEKHFREGGGRITMPTGPSIFETIGDWENFSTPSRDLRLLIAIDVVRGFPARVEKKPARFRLPTGQSPKDAATALKVRLDQELAQRKVEYIKSDESKFALTLADILARAPALEVAYNPNDCPEARWGAAEGSPEMAACRRRAPSDQRRKMEDVRAWFRDRQRPARR